MLGPLDRRWVDPRRVLQPIGRRRLRDHPGLAALFDHLAENGPAAVPREPKAARIACVGLTAFKRRFSELESGPWRSFIRAWRMRCARRLLPSPFLLVHEVARLCGIPDASAFSRDFKEDCGETPKEFRRRRAAAAATHGARA